jgi:hypothetical protein
LLNMLNQVAYGTEGTVRQLVDIYGGSAPVAVELHKAARECIRTNRSSTDEQL